MAAGASGGENSHKSWNLFSAHDWNHDYDCEGDRPEPRGTSNYFHYFGPPTINPTAYILDSSGKRTPNFYKKMKIGSTTYMILSLELFPRSSIVLGEQIDFELCRPGDRCHACVSFE